MQRYLLLMFAGILTFLIMNPPVCAQEVGHYVPGVANIRDFAVPPPGFYYEQFNVYYGSDTFKNRNGRSLDSVTIGNRTIELDIDVDIFAIVPTLIWVSPFKLLGADYAAYIAPPLGSTSVGAALNAREFGREVDDSQFGIGDLFVQPLWLGWHGERFDVSLGYGVYAPTGKYDAGDRDNIGLGFWTNQFQLSGLFYVDKLKATAIMLAVTYEIHSNKDGVDITPGDSVSFEWGISQYLSERLEVGVAGYSTWQVENDSGSDVVFRGVKDQVHAAGGQISYWPLKEKLNIAIRHLREFEAHARFQGSLTTLTLTYIF